MKALNLDSTLESFWFLDGLMLGLASIGFIVGLFCLFLGGWFIVIFILMVLGELILINSFFLAPRKVGIKKYKHDLVKNPTAWVNCVLLSDLHAGSRKGSNWFTDIASKVKDLNPHLVLIAGDIVVDWAKEAEQLQPLEVLKPQHGVFFVLGNHDYLDDPKKLCNTLRSFGFYDLTNTHISLRIHNSELRLSGIDDVFCGKPEYLSKPKDQVPHITLAHEPDSILNLKEDQTDLLLCGHTHAGQIRFPLIGSLHIPSLLGKKADFGYKIINGIPTIISRGLGEIRPRARWLCKPEIVLVELGI
ncbi:metallophosphoesterase [Patescibacteria group bacterium]|nr:metallophosphoesterase [Patescibacteria group bacterium]